MNLQRTKYFSIFIFIIFAVALCFFGISVYKNINLGKSNAQGTFNSLIKETTDYINYYGITEEFSNKFTELLQKKNEIAGLIITQDSSTCFAYPVSSPIIQIDNFGEPVIKGNTPIVTIFSSSLPVDNYAKVNITIGIYLIQPNKIFSLAKISFLIILFATILVFIVIIVQYKNDDSIPTEISKPDDEIKISIDNQNIIEQDNILYENEMQEETQQPEIENETNYKPFASNISDPQGLFSQYTGFGWESYFETRLDSELARAASSEQDLSLFLISIKDITFKNIIIPELSKILLNKFKFFRDLVFEYGTNGFAIIVQNMNLDRAMNLSQELYTDISGLLINNQMNNKLGIGITTRSLRLITGSRLIGEAQQALEKAFEEQDLPIVAFRVNPNKYRQYLSDSE